MTRALIAGLFGALASIASAQAADPARSWPPPMEATYEKPTPKFQELLSGWYIRGDLGYRWNKLGTFDAPAPVTSQSYGNGIAATFGAGHKIDWFRADVTIDRGWRTSYSGTTAAAGATQPQYTAKIDALSVMVNGYIDFGSWSGFTPYVGAGVGMTRLKSTQYRDSAFVGAAGPEGEAQNFSWAWMAGVAYQIQPNWVIDMSFRHLDMGDFPSTTGTNPTVGGMFKNVTAQEARIGIRFLFD